MGWSILMFRSFAMTIFLDVGITCRGREIKRSQYNTE